jgi:hypothetical protein
VEDTPFGGRMRFLVAANMDIRDAVIRPTGVMSMTTLLF